MGEGIVRQFSQISLLRKMGGDLRKIRRMWEIWFSMVGWVGFSCLGLLRAEDSLYQQKWTFGSDLTQSTDGNSEGALFDSLFRGEIVWLQLMTRRIGY